MKKCSTCGKGFSGRWKRCDDCRQRNKEAMRRHREKHGYEKSYETHRKWARKRRENVIAHYGGKCVCCGERQFEFLAIDHTNGGGNQHRREIKARGKDLVGWIIANGFPPMFEIRCHNCNQARAFYGACPHESELRLVEEE